MNVLIVSFKEILEKYSSHDFFENSQKKGQICWGKAFYGQCEKNYS